MDKAEWVLRTAKHVEYELRVDFSESDLQLIKFKLDKAEQVPRKQQKQNVKVVHILQSQLQNLLTFKMDKAE